MDGTSLQAKLYRSRMNEARGTRKSGTSATQKMTRSAHLKKKMQAAKKEINKIVSDGLKEYLAPGNYNDEGAEGHIRDRIVGDIGEIIARL